MVQKVLFPGYTENRQSRAIKYQLLGEQTALALPELTNDAEDSIPIGLYAFWSERDGKATSRPETFRIIKPIVPLELDEALR